MVTQATAPTSAPSGPRSSATSASPAPYMHDGSMQTLWDVMDHYNKGGEANPFLDGGIEPLALTEEEIDQLVAFLFTLTDDRFAAREPARQFGAPAEAAARTTRPFRDDAAGQPQDAAVRAARRRRQEPRTMTKERSAWLRARASRPSTWRSASAFFRGLRNLDRRSFLKVSAAAAGRGRRPTGSSSPHSFHAGERRAAPRRRPSGLPLRLHLRLAPLRSKRQRPLRQRAACAPSTT